MTQRFYDPRAGKVSRARDVIFANLFVFGNLAAARAAPSRPEVEYDNFAAEVGETEAAFVERLKLVVEDAFGKRSHADGRFRLLRAFSRGLRLRRRRGR